MRIRVEGKYAFLTFRLASPTTPGPTQQRMPPIHPHVTAVRYMYPAAFSLTVLRARMPSLLVHSSLFVIPPLLLNHANRGHPQDAAFHSSKRSQELMQQRRSDLWTYVRTPLPGVFTPVVSCLVHVLTRHCERPCLLPRYLKGTWRPR
jgi:hypothetical protein